MPMKIELIAENSDELQRMLKALMPLIQTTPETGLVAITNDDGKVAAYAATVDVKPARKSRAKTEAPEAPASLDATTEDPEADEDTSGEAPAPAAAPDLLKDAIEKARTLFARGTRGSNRIMELRSKYNPDPSAPRFKFEDVPPHRINEFHADVVNSLAEIPA